LPQIKSLISFSVNSYLYSQIIGHLLGDGNLTLSKTSINPYFIFTQTVLRFEYLWYVFNSISFLCYNVPRFGKSVRKGKVSYFLQVHTRSYPFLRDIFNLFYVKDMIKGNYVKRVPIEIFFLLNPISLAYLAMDDGAKTTGGSGFYLHTKGFTFKEAYLLAGIMHYKFGLFCTVQNHDNRPVIYIRSKSKSQFITIVYPYFHHTLLYKLK